MTRTWVAAAAELETGGLRRVDVEGTAVCLVRAMDGNFYCVDDQCSHEHASLSEGYVLELEIECPMHGSLFDLRTGQVRGLPATEPIATYPVTVVNGDVYVDLAQPETAADG